MNAASATACRVAVLDDYEGVARELGDWSALGPDVVVDVFHDHVPDDDELARRLAPYDVVVAMRERTRFDRELLSRLERLRLLVTTGMGNAAIDMEAASALGVMVCGTGGIVENTVELTWALVLAACRHLEEHVARFRDGRWGGPLGADLAGRTFGVLGLGRIGSRVARVAHAFSMTVVAWSPHLSPSLAASLGVEPVGKEELFRRADVLSVHMVLSDATRHLVGAAELALMQPHAILVNTSRGPIVDESALVEALTSGRLAGAGLDVFASEPLPPDHPLRRLPAVVGTTHIGYSTQRCFRMFYAEIAEDVAAWLAGAPRRVLVEPRRPRGASGSPLGSGGRG